MSTNTWELDLCLFGEGAAGAGDVGTGTSAATGEIQAIRSDAGSGKRANPLENVVYGKQPEPPFAEEATEGTQDAAEKSKTAEKAKQTPEQKRAEFERLIQEEYKDEFAQRTQQLIDRRFKETKSLQSQLQALSPVMQLLAEKYGVKPGDAAGLAKAIEEDSSYYEDEAVEKGVTVEQLKTMKRMERENRALKEAVQKREQQENARRVYADWIQQGEQLKTIYPSFDFEAEARNEQFLSLLKNHIDVRTAYEVVHRDEILGGAMQYTAQQIQQKLVNGIRANTARPVENGLSGQGAVVTKTDVNSLTKQDRDEIERRVLRGERIRF